MDILKQISIALIIIGAVTTTHYYILNKLADVVDKNTLPNYLKFVVVIYGITFSQLLTALLFAFGFKISVILELGELTSDTALSFIDICYFSLVNLTTLGLGQIKLGGHLSFLAGIEAMMGFVLVSCSASLIFKVMNQK